MMMIGMQPIFLKLSVLRQTNLRMMESKHLVSQEIMIYYQESKKLIALNF